MQESLMPVVLAEPTKIENKTLDLDDIVQSFINYFEPKQVQCDDEPETLDDVEFATEYLRAIYLGALRGMYHSQDIPVSDDCLGSWMISPFRDAGALMDKIMDDPFTCTSKLRTSACSRKFTTT